jgi:transcriptional regulator with GAF, ATPase, and Fis domain
VTDDQLATVTRMPGAQSRRQDLVARLRVVHPREIEWRCTVGNDAVVIGRTAQTEGAGPLRHDTVSRNHFEARWDANAGMYVGRDLGSHNGTRIDGLPLGKVTGGLHDQSIVQLGDVTLVFETAAAGALSSEGETSLPNLPGDSLAMHAFRTQLLRAAADPSPVLLIGETGTGKEFAAAELHARSGRSGPLLTINCASLSAQIVDSQLFGHVRGAFTGANADAPGLFRAADGGTLFLDEIGEIPLELQAKLLRVLQQGEVQPVGATKVVKVDVRVIAATNRALDRAVEAGTFRRDLYARLSLWELQLPALAQRRGDILGWIDRLADVWAQRRAEAPRPTGSAAEPAAPRWNFDPESAEALLLHRWNNNLREVDRLVHALSTSLASSERIGMSDLPAWFDAPADAAPAGAVPVAAAGGSGGERPAEGAAAKRAIPTREEFVAVFEQLGGSVRALARHFERDRRQIYRWIESYGLRARSE